MAPWWRVTITTGADQSDAVAAFLVTVTGQGVEEPSSGVICTTVDSEHTGQSLLQQLRIRFGSIDGTMVAMEPVDWSTRWRDGITTRRFGRLVLTPSWLPVTAANRDVVISIDPESAFGSGEHGSTRGALRLLERWTTSGDRLLDLGSGSGILSIAAVALGARSALGIEIDDDALPIAEANAHKNGVGHAVRFVAGDASALAPLAGPAELICSNILRTVNMVLIPVILDALAPLGTVIFAGMELAEEELFLPILAQNGFAAIDDARDAGWWSVAARRR